MNQMTNPALVTAEQDGAVLTLSLGAAPAHALSLAMIESLHRALREAGADDTVHVIVIHGAGRIFCAGHDLKEIARHRSDADQGLAYLTTLFTACGEMMQAITLSPKPTIAVVEGVATAGGLQLVAACDLAYAAPDARFCLPGVRNGGFCSTPAVAVARNVSRKHVMELALSGEMFDADWALSAGLINRVLPQDTLLSFVAAFAARLAEAHPPAVAAGKQTLYQQLELPLDQAYALATQTMIGHFMDPERLKREPRR